MLFVCHRFPYPPKRGGKIRPFNVIRHLTEQGHEVVVASIARSREEAEAGEGIGEHCAEFLTGRAETLTSVARMLLRLPSPTPSSMGYFYCPDLHRQIRERLARQSFDLIFVHCSSVAQYVQDVRGTPKIMDFGDMDSQKWLIYARERRLPLSLGYRFEGAKLERAERRIASDFDYCTCTTRAELDTLDELGVSTPTGWFPNGVDAEYFRPSQETYEPHTFCFIGRMDYFPNQKAMFWFCQHVVPLIRAETPEAKLLIVGANPSGRVRALSALPGVSVTGSVPDVRPYVYRAACSVAPLSIARGTQNKVLESMAMGTPVIVSREASDGVDAVAGEHLLVASTPREYADAVLRLMHDRAERARLARAGRDRVRTHHDWSRSLARLDGLVEDCLKRYRHSHGNAL